MSPKLPNLKQQVYFSFLFPSVKHAEESVVTVNSPALPWQATNSPCEIPCQYHHGEAVHSFTTLSAGRPGQWICQALAHERKLTHLMKLTAMELVSQSV